MEDKYTWFIYVLDTSIDDLVYNFDFNGNFDDLNKKLIELHTCFNGFNNINLKIIMK